MRKFLDDITEDELSEVRKFAEAFFSPKEIAIVMEYDIADFVEKCNLEGHKIYNAFQGGFLKSDYEVRLSVVKLAKSGSSPAQSMAISMIDKVKVKIKET